MKNRILNIALVLAAALTLAGCAQDSGAHKFANKAFISESSFAKRFNIKTDENEDAVSTVIKVAMADIEAADVKATFRVAPELLDRYRTAYYDKDALLLADDHYSTGDLSVTIPAGQVASNGLEFNFTGLLSLVKDSDKTYVLPLKLDSATGVDVLQSASIIYFVFREASLINIVGDVSNNCAWPEFGDFDEVEDMAEFTLEALVNGAAYNNSSSIETIMGIEDVFLIRVGDVTIPKNQLQIATARKDEVNNTTHRQSISNPQMKLNTDRWYHIAVTFKNSDVKVYIDGNLRGEEDFTSNEVNLTNVNFKVPHSDEADGKPRCFWIGYSYDDQRSFMGSMAELRIWNRALTQEELRAEGHFYKVIAPETHADLLAYWKLDGTLKDYSQYRHDLSSKSAIVWREVSLPAKK